MSELLEVHHHGQWVVDDPEMAWVEDSLATKGTLSAGYDIEDESKDGKFFRA